MAMTEAKVKKKVAAVLKDLGAFSFIQLPEVTAVVVFLIS